MKIRFRVSIFIVAWMFLPVVGMADSFSLKRVVIDKSQQMLFGYEGERLMFETRVSTGRWDRSTPNGFYHAEEKHLVHYSRKYHNAFMPFSVLVTGNVFIHGYKEVPFYPASHGCIRVPLSDGKRNPAKCFFEWVEIGTPIEIRGQWMK